MNFEFVPLLQLQRDLLSIPRGWARFQEYLRVILKEDRSDIRLPPLAIMNPMGKEHVSALLDTLLAIGAEDAAANALGEASTQLAGVPGTFKVGLVVADDVMGGWTNRYTAEFSHRFEGQGQRKRGWLAGVLWASDPPSLQGVRQEVLAAVYRASYIQQYGEARTLREMLAQEGYVMSRAGCLKPALDAGDLCYTREIIAPHLDAQDRPTIIACLFGDTAAAALGYTPQGLSERAGLALALREAQSAHPLAVPGAGSSKPR